MADPTPRPPPDLPSDAHKGIAGRVLLVAGSEWMPGAAILAARAAQRAGAGLVTVAIWDPLVRQVLPVSAPEAVMREGGSVDLADEAWHAVLVGPGLGLGAASRSHAREAISSVCVPLVIDADALTVLSEDVALATRRSAPTVLSPHSGEAERLLGRAISNDSAGRLAAAREIALKTRSICCLKGPRTVVTDGERVYVNPSGDNALATAGSGDVLSGILVAYLAQTVTLQDTGWKPFDAAARAVFVHGRAGDHCRERLGSRSVIASDLIEALSTAQKT